MSQDVYTPSVGVGSYDWTGDRAPAGGVHTGQSTITMQDGARFLVAHNVAEVKRKRDQHAVAPTVPAWCAFDVPLASVPVVLDVSLIADVT